MQKAVTICTCDRCGYSFQADNVHIDSLDFMTDEEKEVFFNGEQLHEVNGYELCDKYYNNYMTVFKNFMEVGKE